MRKQGMTDTRACVALLAVCLGALFGSVSATGAEVRWSGADRSDATVSGQGGVGVSGTPIWTDHFSDALASGGEGPVMVPVPAGTFRMGCLQHLGCDRDELPIREVAIADRFALSKHEITFDDWDACVEAGGCNGYRPDDEGWGRGRRPVINVGWDDAQSYVAWLSRSTGETYRLPSEAEWEYAARAGTETRYTWGDDLIAERANCRNERCREEYANTAPAGSFPANPWGFHDLLGNVFEWVQDCWSGSSYEGAPLDGSAWVEGDCRHRITRGGGWRSTPENLRIANRVRAVRDDRQNTVGIRVARALPGTGLGMVPLFPSAADGAPQGFVRVINHSGMAGRVRIDAFDDTGNSYGPVTLSIDAYATAHFNSDDLRRGNAAKGLSEGLGVGGGDLRLRLSSVLDIETLSFIRTPDGFLTAMQQAVPASEGRHRVPIFNPGRNRNQVSHLRLVNAGEEDSDVTITGKDDDGRPGGTVSLALAAGESRTVSSRQLEDGNDDLDGALGTGRGKWRLAIEPSSPILVMNLVESPTGHLTNLSTAPAIAENAEDAGNTDNTANPEEGVQSLPLLPAKSSPGRQGFVRVINLSVAQGDVRIYAVDDDGNRRGPVSLTLDGGAAAHFNSSDLEDGNASKRLSGRTGAGAGDWRLDLTSDLDFEVLVYARTDDGFLTAMQDVAPRQANRHRIAVFNPGSNTGQVSLLRLVNPAEEPARISIRSIDDAGDAGGRVELTLPAGQARTYTAWELESGGGDLEGSLGEGAGKWQLEVASEQPLLAMSLLESPMGHLTNLSDAHFRPMRLATARAVFDELISGPVAQSSCVGCHVANGEADATRLTLVPDTQANHAMLNRQALADFLAEVEGGESLMLAKMRGDADHGGGVQIPQDSDEYANMARFLRLVVAESTASFEAITYEGSATLGNGDYMAARDLLIGVPERTLVDDISVSVSERTLPAALLSGIRQIADSFEIVVGDEHYLNGPLTLTMTYPEGSADNGDIVLLRYEPTLERWLGVTVKSHHPDSRTVVFESRAFGHFALGRATTPLPDGFSTGFDAARHGFSIENEAIEYHTKGGNAFGMSAYAIYHFNFAQGNLHGRWNRTVQTLVATIAQATTPAMYLDSRWWRSFQFDGVSSIKRAIRFNRSPVVLLLARPDGKHAVVAYGYEGDELLVYDPNNPRRAGRTVGGGREYSSGSRVYSVSHAVQLSSVGRLEDFEGLKNAADAGFPDSELLSVDVADGREVFGRRLGFSGDLSGALDHEDVSLSVYDGRYPLEVARTPVGAFDGSLDVHYGDNAIAFLAGRRAGSTGAARLAPLAARNWELPTAGLIRRVTGITRAAVLRITAGWNAPADVDVFVQEPDNGEILFWGNRETVNAMTFDADNRGTDTGEVEHTETAMLLQPREPHAGEYRVFLHQYDDHGLNADVDVTVEVELYEGDGSRHVPLLHGTTMYKGQYGLAGATTVQELLNLSAVEVARVDPGMGRICFFDAASGRFDACADGAGPDMGTPRPVAATNGGLASAKPDSGSPPDPLPGPDLEILIDSASLPELDCTYESPWRACFHSRDAAAEDLVEVKISLPQESSGVWHGAWCVKATSEGLCEGAHDSTDRVEKRFAGNATLSFVTRAPRDATSFWIVGEIRECEQPRCYWPTDYTEVEFHRIEVDVQAGPGAWALLRFSGWMAGWFGGPISTVHRLEP